MAYYYKVTDIEKEELTEGVQIFKGDSPPAIGPCIKYDFSTHVLIELLDNVAPPSQIWGELGLIQNKSVVHKRLLVDPHRVNCRRAIVVCTTPHEAKEMAQRLTQTKILRRCICAVVIQELLSDLRLFEKQIMEYGDKKSQQQLIYVTDLNRCRGPAGLAEYLREKFSPFGTILSVFVSEDKDGYAFPEGVIRFAHLSEAFAAELAYDQCVVAMERLSVATHHNILLSQCDLRARLREAQSRHANETYSHASPDLQDTNNSLVQQKTSSDCSFDTHEKSSKTDEKEGHQLQNEDVSSVQEHSEFPSDSAELADVLEKDCNVNLVDCLEGIAMDSECGSSVSQKKADDSVSVTSSEPGTEQNGIDPINNPSPSGSTVTVLNSRNKTWSSRIVGWITDLPSVDDILDNSNRPSNDPWRDKLPVGTDNQQIPEKADVNENQSEKNKTDVQQHSPVSTSGSFVTCRNGDITASYNSNPSSPLNAISETSNNNNTLLADISSPEKPLDDEDVEDDLIENGNRKDVFPTSTSFSISNSDSFHVSTSQKRKNSSLITQKLSLKNQRLDSSQSLLEVSESETTLHLPSVIQSRQCHVVLDCVPALDELARNIAGLKAPVNSSLKEPVNNLERIGSSQTNLANSNFPPYPLPVTASKSRRKKKAGSTVSNPSDLVDSCTSLKSLSIRRSSRLASRQSDLASSFSEESSVNNGVGESTSTALVVFSEQENNFLNGKENESPLRSWLKKELMSSTNNRMTGSQESTKSIVCASINKDVLISVGCSHMTCDFCYPDSTKLLLGFH